MPQLRYAQLSFGAALYPLKKRGFSGRSITLTSGFDAHNQGKFPDLSQLSQISFMLDNTAEN